MDTRVKELNDLKERIEALPSEAAAEIADLEERIAQLEDQLKNAVSAWDHLQLSRHEDRPYTLDYVERLFESFCPLHGDRKFADDPAIVAGLAIFDAKPVMVIGHQKGRNTKERLHRNYGMPKPEGYRKSVRLMQLAAKFNRPVLTLIDTPGAYPGIGAEERGQAEAIAYSLRAMTQLPVPVIATVLGEGGSGGALAIGVGDRVLMLEHAIYSVISPESCSAILWKDQEHAKEAAQSLRISAPDLLELGVIDDVVEEPPGGAHTDWDQAAANLKEHLRRHLAALCTLSPQERLLERLRKFRRMGEFLE